MHQKFPVVCYAFAVVLTFTLALPAHADFSDATAKGIFESCSTDQLGRGKPKADVEKGCQCVVDEMKKIADEDQAQLFLAGAQSDQQAIARLLKKNGRSWFDTAIKDMKQRARKMDTKCGTR
jgi:hypothetical protein